MSDNKRIDVDGAIDSRWLSYWPPTDGETVGAPGDKHNGKLTTEGIPNMKTDIDRETWPPTAEMVDDIRNRLMNGETSTSIAEDYPRSSTTMTELAKGNLNYEPEGTSTPPLENVGSERASDWQPIDEGGDMSVSKSEPNIMKRPPAPQHNHNNGSSRVWIIAACVAFIIGWLMGRGGGSDE